jgi:hypothetical protein
MAARRKFEEKEHDADASGKTVVGNIQYDSVYEMGSFGTACRI